MSEETQKDGAPQGPAQMLALSGASRAKADAWLELQMEEMRAEEPYKLSHFRLRRFSGWAKAALEFSLGLIALGVAGGLGAMVWNAAHADGLIVESFKVPPELAAKGLTGDVVATRLLDELSSMQAQSTAIRAASSYANNWGDDLKVEIPETGVSLGEVSRYLRSRLGHETHISGEVVRLDSGGIEMSVRSGSEAGESVTGNTADIHALLQKAAAAIYARTQPNRYGAILNAQGRAEEAAALALAHTQSGPIIERAWAYNLLANSFLFRNRPDDALRTERQATTLNPGSAYGWYRTAVYNIANGEEALATAKKSLSMIGAGTADLVPDTVRQVKSAAQGIVARLTGDFEAQARTQAEIWYMIDLSADPATQFRQALSATGGSVVTPIAVQTGIARTRLIQHELGAARRVLAQEAAYMAAFKSSSGAAADIRGQIAIDRAAQYFRGLEVALALETRNWARVRELVPAREAVQSRLAAAYAATAYPPVDLWPDLAVAEAGSGNFATAHALIDRTPADCTLCLRARARIAIMEKNYGAADYWFATSGAKFPSIPYAYADWGQSLLARGKPDDAIAQFTLANKKGPHFADPLEGWGEALMAKNQSHLALAKFAAAEKYAPNWGRLQLKWGEALTYAGKPADAKAHFARAAALDLTPDEKSELNAITLGAPHG